MHRRLLNLGSVLFLALPACAEAPDVETETRTDFEVPSRPAADGLGARTELPPLAASGRVENLDSPITPWCDAVLIAPDVAVTTTHCIEGRDAEWFSVSFGDPSAPRTANVVEVLDHLDPEERLTALLLDAPVADVEPATLYTDDARRCGFAAVSHLHADKRIGAASRWIWRGCLDRDELVARSGTPNCHGDEGSGVFVDEALVGITVGPGAFAPDVLCSDAVRIVTLREADAFFGAALDASRL